LNTLTFEVLALVVYAAMFLLAVRGVQTSTEFKWSVIVGLILAAALHGYSVYRNIDTPDGQNLSLFNIFAMTTWVASLMVVYNLIRHRAYSLLLVSLPVTIISLVELILFKGSDPVRLSGKWADLAHIFAGIFSMSVILLAALQAALVLYLDHGLKHRPAKLHDWVGPLDAMERFLFQLLTVSFIATTVTFLLVFNLPAEAKAAQPLHKVILTLLAWIILAALMFGRYVRGWRGVYAARWTLVGAGLLLLGYFGSKWVIEYILNS